MNVPKKAKPKKLSAPAPAPAPAKPAPAKPAAPKFTPVSPLLDTMRAMKSLVPHLARLVRRERPVVKWSAAEALLAVGEFAEKLSPLLAALGNEDLWDRPARKTNPAAAPAR